MPAKILLWLLNPINFVFFVFEFLFVFGIRPCFRPLFKLLLLELLLSELLLSFVCCLLFFLAKTNMFKESELKSLLLFELVCLLDFNRRLTSDLLMSSFFGLSSIFGLIS
jgi:hypothetical protein